MEFLPQKVERVEERLSRMEKDFEKKWSEDIAFRTELLRRLAAIESSFGKLWSSVIAKAERSTPVSERRASSGRKLWEEVILLSLASILGALTAMLVAHIL